MIAVLKECHRGRSLVIPESLKYSPPFGYGPKDSHIPHNVQKLFLSNALEFNRVNGFLTRLEWEPLETVCGKNNVIEDIRLQLHVPKKYSNDMMRHQLASFLIQEVDFFYPLVESHLETLNINFCTYVHGIYSGEIWGDEIMIGAIGKMFNIRISIVSPYYNDVWNVYHDARYIPDIVLIANGLDFGHDKKKITHISATKGDKETWSCLGRSDDKLTIDKYKGHIDGQRTAIDLFSITENSKILRKTHSVLKDINKLCSQVKEICTLRDDTIEKLKGIDIDIGNFQRLTLYYVAEEMPVAADASRMPRSKRRTEIVPSASRGIPKIRIRDSRTTDFGKQLLDDVIEIMDEGEDFSGLDKHVNLTGVHVTKKSATVMKKKKPCATACNIAIAECMSDILADVTLTKDNGKESSTIRLHEETQIDRSYEEGEIIEEEDVYLSAIFIDHEEHLTMENSVMIPHELEY